MATLTPQQAFELCATAVQPRRRHPEAWSILVQNTELSYQFAENIVRGPFPEGEQAIAKDAYLSLQYARLIKKSFSLGESIIARDAAISFRYAKTK